MREEDRSYGVRWLVYTDTISTITILTGGEDEKSKRQEDL